MKHSSLKVSAPGSLMLTGEHAVLRGYPALVAAVNLRLCVEILPHDKNEILIESDKFGILTTPLENLNLAAMASPFHFMGQVLSKFTPYLKNGLRINITSEFSPTLGLGSSAALTVSLFYALSLWFNIHINKKNLALRVIDIIRSSQNGLGSGADVIASVYGGVVYFITKPFQMECLTPLPPLVTVYSGSKTATPIVIDLVNQNEKNNPAQFHAIFKQIGDYSIQAREAIIQQDWPHLGALFSAHALLQEALGVSTSKLDEIQQRLVKQPSIYGAKISGSGLGDCVIAVGELPENSDIDVVPVSLSNQGVQHERT